MVELICALSFIHFLGSDISISKPETFGSTGKKKNVLPLPKCKFFTNLINVKCYFKVVLTNVLFNLQNQLYLLIIALT